MSKDYVDLNELFEGKSTPISLIVTKAVNEIREYQAGKVGFKFGLTHFDDHMGLFPRELTVIAARSSTGKTFMGMQIVENVLAQMVKQDRKGRVVVFSAEMSATTLVQRAACAATQNSFKKMKDGSLAAKEYDRVVNAAESIYAGASLSVDDSPAPTLEHMATELATDEEVYGSIALVLFDYTELAGEFGQGEADRVRKITRGLAAIAKRFNCPVITLSQLNRDIERRADKKPTMADLMSGGERGPDNIVILTRPGMWDETIPKEKVLAYTIKNRHGVTKDDIGLRHNPDTLRFQSVDWTATNINNGLNQPYRNPFGNAQPVTPD